MILPLLVAIACLYNALTHHEKRPAPSCVSWHIATRADTTFYETQCTGGARPDSIANPEQHR